VLKTGKDWPWKQTNGKNCVRGQGLNWAVGSSRERLSLLVDTINISLVTNSKISGSHNSKYEDDNT
jgi:hypothetical protein